MLLRARFRTYMALRGGGEFELILPNYIRVSVIFYALVYGAYGALSSFTSTNLAFSFNLYEAVLIFLNALFYVGLTALCIFPPRFIVGENNLKET